MRWEGSALDASPPAGVRRRVHFRRGVGRRRGQRGGLQPWEMRPATLTRLGWSAISAVPPSTVNVDVSAAGRWSAHYGQALCAHLYGSHRLPLRVPASIQLSSSHIPSTVISTPLVPALTGDGQRSEGRREEADTATCSAGGAPHRFLHCCSLSPLFFAQPSTPVRSIIGES